MIRRLLPWIIGFALGACLSTLGTAAIEAGYPRFAMLYQFLIGLWLGALWWHNRQRAKIARLVIAARVVAFGGASVGDFHELDQAVEEFAAAVAWDDQPEGDA